jgi:hypothetical protein
MDSIKKALAIVQIAMGIIPQIIELVKAVEVGGHGPEKADAVGKLIKAALELMPETLRTSLGIDRIEAFATRVITIVVSFLNAVGVFQKTPAKQT